MLKALLVDDEPFILQGLQLLIDWDKAGFEVHTASNGEEAYEYLQSNSVDLIIADIKMPVMTGIELLKKIREDLNLDTYFIILSGYAEFEYARQALHYHCTDYILKPVEKDQLKSLLKKITDLAQQKTSKEKNGIKREKALMERTLMHLLSGKYDVNDLEYIEDKVPVDDEKCYVEIQLNDSGCLEECADEDKRTRLDKIYQAVIDYLKQDALYCIRDVSDNSQIYDIGFVYSSFMAQKIKSTREDYLRGFYNYIVSNTNLSITMLVGKMVSGIRNVSKSYGTANMLRSLQGFRAKKDIYFYEEEYKVNEAGLVICKKQLDMLINAIETGEHVNIRKCVDDFYEEMQKMGVTGSTIDLNVNYLLFQLIHLASELDSEVNQEEILRIISESTSEEDISRSSKTHLCRMAYAYSEYLCQLRKNVSCSVLVKIEDEIKKNYSSNLTLKDLSEKYYVNSAYLGQLFRKKCGCSFKDYLNRTRIEAAAKLLRKTDMKVYEIAESVGYKDADYFVNKFIEAKGCTPTKYKKNIG